MWNDLLHVYIGHLTHFKPTEGLVYYRGNGHSGIQITLSILAPLFYVT